MKLLLAFTRGTGLAIVLLLTATSVLRADSLDLPQGLDRDPEARGFADLLFANAMVMLAEDDYSGALPWFEKAAATRPRDATYRYFAALCKLRLDSAKEALTDLRACLPPASSRIPEARVRLGLGEANYRLGDYPAAEKELQSSLRLDGDDAWARFYLGLSLFAMGRTEEALRELDAAASAEPSLADTTAYYRGVVAFERGDREGSREHFEQALRSPPNSATRASARGWLSSIDTVEGAAVPRGELRVGLSLAHDDNPGQISDDLFFTPSGAESTYRSAYEVRAAYHPMAEPGGWTLGLVFNGYLSDHAEFDPADVRAAQGVFQAALGSDPLGFVNGALGYSRVPQGESRFGFLIQAGAAYFDLDERSFKRDQEIAAGLSIYQSGFGKTQIELHYDDETFFDPFLEFYSGERTTLRVGQYFQLGGRPDRYVRVALAGSDHSTNEPGLERTGIELLSELALPLSSRWMLFFYGTYAVEDYDDESMNFFFIGDNREDSRTELSATATVTLSPHANASLRYAWGKREVDPIDFFLDSLDHDRQILTAGVTLHW